MRMRCMRWGSLREAQGNAAEAQSWYQKAAAADAIWTRPLMKLAELATAAGDRAAASRHLARVIDIDAASPDGQSAAASEILKQIYGSGIVSQGGIAGLRRSHDRRSAYCNCLSASSISRSLSSFVMFF